MHRKFAALVVLLLVGIFVYAQQKPTAKSKPAGNTSSAHHTAAATNPSAAEGLAEVIVQVSGPQGQGTQKF